MRIRNSRMSFSMLPLPPEQVSRKSPFPSRRQCSDDRFLVEEVNRHIKWSSCPLRKPSDPDAQAAPSHDQSQPALAGETKSLNRGERKIGRDDYMLRRPSHAYRKTEETGKRGGKSNRRSFNREDDKSRFSASIVLALRAPTLRPERELPFKKRMYRRRLKTEKIEVAKRSKVAVTEGDANSTTIPEQEAKMDTTSVLDKMVKMETAVMPEKENLSECDGNQRSKSINCLLNQESSLPSPIIHGLQGQDSGENLFLDEMPNEFDGMQKRGRGRPKKATGRRAKGVGTRTSKYFLD